MSPVTHCIFKRADNVVAAEHTNPPLTTLAAGSGKLGTLASETLLARLAGADHEGGVPRQYFAVPELIVRESSGSAIATVAGKGGEGSVRRINRRKAASKS